MKLVPGFCIRTNQPVKEWLPPCRALWAHSFTHSNVYFPIDNHNYSLLDTSFPFLLRLIERIKGEKKEDREQKEEKESEQEFHVSLPGGAVCYLSRLSHFQVCGLGTGL